MSLPRPIQEPGPPILLGGSGPRTLRVVAEHADIWNTPGPPHASVQDVARRSQVLNRLCDELGRDPAEITRSTQMVVSYDDPRGARETILQLSRVDIPHVVLALPTPYPKGVAAWAANEIIGPSAEAAA